MGTQDLVLLTDLIRTNSLDMSWHNNGQMWRRRGRKDGKPHGDSKVWHTDGSLWFHKVWENGRLVKFVAW